MRRVIAAGVLVAALAGGCSSGSHHVTSPSTTAAPNPEVVPAAITRAYVDSLFVVLNHVSSNAARELRIAHSVTPQVKANLRAAFNDPAYSTQLEGARQALAQGIVNNVRLNGGDPVTTVIQFLTADPDCIFVQTRTDFSPVEIRLTPQPASEYYELTPKQAGADPDHLNSTPWAIARNEAFETSTTVASTCPE
jgi:hypothetical protein